LNSCKLTLAFLPPPPAADTADIDVDGACECGRAIDSRVLSRVEWDKADGRSKMELPNDDWPGDDAGEPLRVRVRNVLPEVADEERGTGVAMERSERARERAAGEGVVLTGGRGGGGMTAV
jgi:hypothetical protein